MRRKEVFILLLLFLGLILMAGLFLIVANYRSPDLEQQIATQVYSAGQTAIGK